MIVFRSFSGEHTHHHADIISSTSAGHILCHEADFLRLVTLATKQANTPSSDTPTKHPPPAQQEELEGGKLSDQPKMADPPPPLSASILAHDDEALKASILDILNSTNETCQAKSAKIMDAILQHRRKKVLELDRERIAPATARFLSEGGSNPNQTVRRPLKKKRENKHKLKESSKQRLKTDLKPAANLKTIKTGQLEGTEEQREGKRRRLVAKMSETEEEEEVEEGERTF